MLFRKSVEKRSVPREWKITVVVYIYERHYRSILLTTTLCKTLGKKSILEMDRYLQRKNQVYERARVQGDRSCMMNFQVFYGTDSFRL